ncbi:transmembrane protein 198-like isoform X2 [Columba livia]
MEPSVLPCAPEPRPSYEPVPAALCALGSVFGLVCGCFGYRCFKATMFLSGLLFGSTVIFLLCRQERELQLSLEASATVTAAIGLLCGLLTVLLRAVGLFATGLLLGLLVATAALVTVLPPPPSPWVTAGMLLGLALLCALLALRWPKAVTILATAAFGAAVVVVCADYLAEGLALVAHITARLQLAPAQALCWHGWLLLGAWPVLSVLGVLLQWRVTASGFSHRDAPHSRWQRPQQPELKCRQNPAPSKGTHRCRPPPVTRQVGDALPLGSGGPGGAAPGPDGPR